MAILGKDIDPGLFELTLSIGARVRGMRKLRGMSRRSLAELSGVSERYLAKLEIGDGNVTVGILYRLARVFDCQVESFVATQSGFGLEKAARIALVGLRGAGKTTLGMSLAAQFDIPFLEVSNQIESLSGMAVAEVIALYGASGFRRYEEEALASIVEDQSEVVIAVGGGIVEENANFDLLLRHFHTIWIQTSPAEHIARVRAQGDERPMRGFAEAEAHLRSLLADRKASFSRADHSINTANVDADDSARQIGNLVDGLGIFPQITHRTTH